MSENMAYIITRINKRHRLVLVELIEFREMKTKVLCKRLDNNEIVEREYPRQIILSSDFKNGIRICRERDIIYTFKMKSYRKDKTFKCSLCNFESKNIKEITVDHKIPLKSFSNIDDMNNDSWKKAWSEKNLQLCCQKCNLRKSHFSEKKNSKLKDISSKKIMIINRNMRKGRGFRKFKHSKIDVNKKNSLELARMSDTPYLDVDYILNKGRR